MTLSGEGILILGIIMTMMVADLIYDGSTIALRERFAVDVCGADAAWAAGPQPLAPALAGSGDR